MFRHRLPKWLFLIRSKLSRKKNPHEKSRIFLTKDVFTEDSGYTFISPGGHFEPEKASKDFDNLFPGGVELTSSSLDKMVKSRIDPKLIAEASLTRKQINSFSSKAKAIIYDHNAKYRNIKQKLVSNCFYWKHSERPYCISGFWTPFINSGPPYYMEDTNSVGAYPDWDEYYKQMGDDYWIYANAVSDEIKKFLRE